MEIAIKLLFFPQNGDNKRVLNAFIFHVVIDNIEFLIAHQFFVQLLADFKEKSDAVETTAIE